MTNFHGQMMNIQHTEGSTVPYKTGHRDARHAAAEIALKADVRINELVCALECVLSLIEQKRAHDGPAAEIIRNVLREGKQ